MRPRRGAIAVRRRPGLGRGSSSLDTSRWPAPEWGCLLIPCADGRVRTDGGVSRSTPASRRRCCGRPGFKAKSGQVTCFAFPLKPHGFTPVRRRGVRGGGPWAPLRNPAGAAQTALLLRRRRPPSAVRVPHRGVPEFVAVPPPVFHVGTTSTCVRPRPAPEPPAEHPVGLRKVSVTTVSEIRPRVLTGGPATASAAQDNRSWWHRDAPEGCPGRSAGHGKVVPQRPAAPQEVPARGADLKVGGAASHRLAETLVAGPHNRFDKEEVTERDPPPSPRGPGGPSGMDTGAKQGGGDRSRRSGTPSTEEET